MYNEVYTFLPDMHRWHLVAVVSFGYFCYYIREVVKVLLRTSDNTSNHAKY